MGFETVLGSIKEFVSRFSEIISNAVDLDVIIVDNNLEIVGSSFRYFSLYNAITFGTLTAEVISTKDKVIVKDKSKHESCKECEQFYSCKMVGFVGEPIHYKGYVIGAIALILPQHRVEPFFKNIDSSIEFLENMAELLAGKVKENNFSQSLKQTIAERETIMNLLDDAIVYTDYYGNIEYCNKTFLNILGIKQTNSSDKLQDLIPQAVLIEYFKNYKELFNVRFFIPNSIETFYGFVTSKEVKVAGKTKGIMFTFKTANEVIGNSKLVENGSLLTLNWAEWLFEKEILNEAKMVAVTNKSVLILGNDGNLNEMLAKGITNYSSRNLKGLKILNCDNVYRELMDTFLFDEFGELRDADNGTMLVQSIENLPYNIQERLLFYLKTGRVPLNNGVDIEIDVRFIFTTTKDLKKLVEKGLFIEELYFHITEYQITTYSFQDKFERFKNILLTGFKHYEKVYKRKITKINEEAIQYLYKSTYKDNLNQLEMIIEAIVRNNDKEITVDYLIDMGFSTTIESEQLLSDLEKRTISELLNSALSKTEIAKRLGISRSTLYRKLEEYELA